MPAWKSSGGHGRSHGRGRGGRTGQSTRPLKRPHSINDSYCIINPVPEAQSVSYVRNITDKDFSVTVPILVSCPVFSPVSSASECKRPSQKKDTSPLSKQLKEIKSVKSASIVDHCVLATTVGYVPSVTHAQLVGSCLQIFWQTWSLLGANPRVMSILKEGCFLSKLDLL